MSFSTAVGRRPPWATFSALNSHRSEDPGSKVGRWPRFGPATVLNDIALTTLMGGCSRRQKPYIMLVRSGSNLEPQGTRWSDMGGRSVSDGPGLARHLRFESCPTPARSDHALDVRSVDSINGSLIWYRWPCIASVEAWQQTWVRSLPPSPVIVALGHQRATTEGRCTIRWSV